MVTFQHKVKFLFRIVIILYRMRKNGTEGSANLYKKMSNLAVKEE